MNTFIDILNHAAPTGLRFALGMFLQSTLLLALLLAIDFVLRRRVRATVRYAVWLLLLLKLVLPPSLALPTGIGYWLGSIRPDNSSQTPTLNTQPAQSAVRPQTDRKMYVQFTDGVVQKHLLGRDSWLLMIWIGGAFALLGVLVHRSRAVRRQVSTAQTVPEHLASLLADGSKQLALRATPQLRLTDAAVSPAVCGLWRPVILLPTRLVEKLSELQLRAVLLHELAHVKRADVWANYAQTLLQIFYWWHPLLWLANARIRWVREEAVDELVMVELGRDADSYPLTLVEVAKLTLSRAVLSLGFVGILESRSALKQRVHRLVNYPPPRSARLNIMSLLVCAALGAMLLPMARGQRTVTDLSAASASAVVTKDDPPFIGAKGTFVLLPKKKLQAMMLPGDAPAYSASRVKGWAISQEQYETFLVKAEGLGGLQSGTDTALLPGFEGFTPNGKYISLGITEQLMSLFPDGKRMGEARTIPPNQIDGEAARDSRIELVAKISKGKTFLNLKAQCETGFNQKLADGKERAYVETNFVFSAKMEQPAGSHGVVLLCEESEQNDDRALIVLLTTRARNEDEVNGQGIIRISTDGRFALNDKPMTLDQLHSALFEESQKFYHYAVQIERQPGTKEDDLEKVQERLRWLKIDDVKTSEPAKSKAGMSLERPQPYTTAIPGKVIRATDGKEIEGTLVGYETVNAYDLLQSNRISTNLTSLSNYRAPGFAVAGSDFRAVYVPLNHATIDSGQVSRKHGETVAGKPEPLSQSNAQAKEKQSGGDELKRESVILAADTRDAERQLQTLRARIARWQARMQQNANDPKVSTDQLAKDREYLADLEKQAGYLEYKAQGTPKAITIKAMFVSGKAEGINKLSPDLPATVAIMKRYGLNTSSRTLSPEELATAWKLAKDRKNFEILASPAITTADGREAEMFVGTVSDIKSGQNGQHNNPGQGSTTISPNAIPYVNVLKQDGKEIDRTILIGPSLSVLPKISAKGIELTAEAMITERVPINIAIPVPIAPAQIPVRTNFQAKATSFLQNGGGMLLLGSNPDQKAGPNYAVIVSAMIEDK